MAIVLILPIFEYLEHELIRNILGWIINALAMVTNIFLLLYMILF